MKMNESVCIRIWTRDTVPEQFRHLATYADDTDGDGGVLEYTKFVAHVPAKMLSDRTYEYFNGESGDEGWMYPGGPGWFGINALDTFPHPDGDGILIVGSAI